MLDYSEREARYSSEQTLPLRNPNIYRSTHDRKPSELKRRHDYNCRGPLDEDANLIPYGTKTLLQWHAMWAD